MPHNGWEGIRRSGVALHGRPCITDVSASSTDWLETYAREVRTPHIHCTLSTFFREIEPTEFEHYTI